MWHRGCNDTNQASNEFPTRFQGKLSLLKELHPLNYRPNIQISYVSRNSSLLVRLLDVSFGGIRGY